MPISTEVMQDLSSRLLNSYFQPNPNSTGISVIKKLLSPQGQVSDVNCVFNNNFKCSGFEVSETRTRRPYDFSYEEDNTLSCKVNFLSKKIIYDTGTFTNQVEVTCIFKFTEILGEPKIYKLEINKLKDDCVSVDLLPGNTPW